MPITALPSLDRTSATFKTDLDSYFLTSLPAFSSEANALQTDVNAKQVTASAAATNAETQVTLAAAQATNAATSALAAASSAAVAGAVAWVSGLTYAVGDARYSPVNLQTYRRKVSGAGTTDPSADPTNWAKAVDTGPSGALVLLSTITASAATTVDIETGFSSTYDDYIILCNGVSQSASANLNGRLKIGGTYLSGAVYDGVQHYAGNGSGGGAETANPASNSTSMTTGFLMNSGSTTLRIEIQDANSSLAKSVYSRQISANAPTYVCLMVRSSFSCQTAGVLSGIRLFPASGTITGTFRLYGITKA